MNHKLDASFIDEHHLRIGDLDFYCAYEWGQAEVVPDGSFSMQKNRAQVERYLELSTHFKPKVIVELGIRQGGSTALLHALYQPKLLVAIELATEPAPALSTYVETNGLHSTIKPHYGVNQADREAVTSIMEKELNGNPIDLVIDDASHLLFETRISFETLFPLLRPGGLYVIEDWNCDHLLADGIEAIASNPKHPKYTEVATAIERKASKNQDPDPRLIRFPLELVLMRASSHDFIREITIMDNWVIVQRGSEPIEAQNFRIDGLVKDHFSNLQPLPVLTPSRPLLG